MEVALILLLKCKPHQWDHLHLEMINKCNSPACKLHFCNNLLQDSRCTLSNRLSHLLDNQLGYINLQAISKVCLLSMTKGDLLMDR